MNKKYKFSLILFSVIILAIAIELLRDALTREGDFAGYVAVGNWVLKGWNIYSQRSINTWPPFFSIVTVPIAILNNLNIYLVRFLWLAGSVIAMFYIMNYTTLITLNKKISIFPNKSGKIISQNDISIFHWVVLIPLLYVLRYLLDNLSNIQINVFMLLFAVSSIYFFTKNKNILAAFLLSFSISIKVYTVFLLLYFVIKREYKIVIYTVLFCVLFSIIPFFIFGIDHTISYYTFWYKNTVEPFVSGIHKNQSFFVMMRRFFLHENPNIEEPFNKAIYLNVINLTIVQIKILSYGLVAIVGAFVLYIFRKKLTERNSLKTFIEYAFILNVIPVLSPLAWKAYFIFLFPSYFINYLFIYVNENKLNKTTRYYLKISFLVSIMLTILSTEIVVGRYLSVLMETFSCITIGSILMAINLLIYYVNFDKYKIKKL